MDQTEENEEADVKDDFTRGIAYFWRSTNLEPHIRSVAFREGISKVALGNHHTLLLTFNSQVLSVGDNSFGQLGLGDLKSRREPTVVDYLRDKPVHEISCGGQHSGVICDNRDVFFWGDSSRGQCGIDETNLVNLPSPVRFERSSISDARETQQNDSNKQREPVIIEISCGDSHSLALSSEGEVWSWGTGCQLGHGVETDRINIPKQIDGLIGKNVTAIACGAYHSLAIVQEDQPYPTFVLSGNDREAVTSKSTHKVKREKSGKKQRKLSKGSSKKSQVSGKHEKERDFKVEPVASPLETEKYGVTRTYLSYEPVASETNAEGFIRDVANKGTLLLQDKNAKIISKKEEPILYCSDDDILNIDVNNEDEAQVTHDTASAVHIHDRDISLDIIDTGFASLEKNDFEQYLNISSDQSFQEIHSAETTASEKNISYSSTSNVCLSTVSPSSPTSSRSITYFVSTDSDSEDSLNKVIKDRKPTEPAAPSRTSSGLYSAIGSRLVRPDVNLSKLTSAVMGSVTGMFMSSTPGQFSVFDAPKAVMAKDPCRQCGLLGVCLCEGTNRNKFKLAGSNTQVWSWGRGGCGQLGLGDTEDRFHPCCIKELSNVGVIKLAAGTFHSLAQTVYSQVFSWGDNSCGQLGRKKSMALYPKKIRCFSDVLIWDIAAGSHYSLFIGDMALSKADVYVCGRQPSAMPSVAATMNNIRESTSMPCLVSEDGSTTAHATTEKGMLSQSQSFDDTKERSLQHSRVEIVRLTMFRKVGQLRSVSADTERCVCLAGSDKSGMFEIMSDLASEERLFYYQLALIWQAVLTPFLQSEVWSCLALEEVGQVLSSIIQAFYIILKCVSTSLTSVTQLVVSMKDFQDLFNLCWSDDFLQAFERYSESFSNGAAFGVFSAVSSVTSDISSQSKTVLRDIMDDAAQEFVGYDNAFQCVMQFPLMKMQHYQLIVGKFQNTLKLSQKHENIVNCARMEEEAKQWEQLITEDENRQAEAERTFKFWVECPAKVAEIFKHPRRRLLRSSNIHSLFPSKGSRFSTPLFVLFDDFFVHYQITDEVKCDKNKQVAHLAQPSVSLVFLPLFDVFVIHYCTDPQQHGIKKRKMLLMSAKSFQAFPLTTVWAEGVDDTEGVLNSIKITTPEEVLLVCAPSTVDKADWLLTINQAVAAVISRTTTYRLGGDSVNVKTGSLAPAAAREASYSYGHDSVLRGASYHGMWLQGKPHGHGEMHWPDGRQYTGEFKHGLQHGEGVMIFPPNVDDHSKEKYEGQWENGKMAGYGKVSYSNGDVYVGDLFDNQRSGHGSMKSGTLSSAGATLYIGEWLRDKRSGYGVLDNVLRGEKYLGMWEADFRTGPGVLVTLDGIYNQGNFSQNKLIGNGLLLCDDDTKFEGEFIGDCLLSGKGVLTMPNGDYIEGTFTGTWGDGIRINGTFHKLEAGGSANKTTRRSVTYNQCLIPPQKKWMSLFSQCRKALGCNGDQDADLSVVWKSISVTLRSKWDSKLTQSEKEIILELLQSNSEMEQTARVTGDLEKLQSYLSKAMNTKQHPVGQLVNGLIDVFRASYIGMGTHRRLLPHAVAEVKSFVIRVYNIICLLFPELPNEEYVHLDTATLSGVSNHGTEEAATSSVLLHPLLFPRLYPPLFTLYALDNERADSAYWEQIQLLNKRSDWALMTYVGMKRQFWLTKEQDVGSRSDEVKLERREAEHYVSAVESLRQISTKFSPMEKLGVLKSTFEQINQEVNSFWQGEKKLVSLDDLFPVFQFVVIRARIPHLGSEIQFIDDMVDSHVHVGEQGHMFTTLKAAIFQIQNEKG